MVFYVGAIIGVILFDYYLHNHHWINDLIKDLIEREETDQPDGAEMETSFNESFKRRPSISLKKVH